MLCPDWYVFLPNQMLLLTRACEDLERERQDREEEKVRYLGEKLPPLQLSGMSLDELQVRPHSLSPLSPQHNIRKYINTFE